MTDLTLVDPELHEGLSFFPPLQLTTERLAEMRLMSAALPTPELSPARGAPHPRKFTRGPRRR